MCGAKGNRVRPVPPITDKQLDIFFDPSYSNAFKAVGDHAAATSWCGTPFLRGGLNGPPFFCPCEQAAPPGKRICGAKECSKKRMTDDALKETITRLAQPLASSLGLIVWGVEIVRAGRTVVRLFVDVPFAAASATPCLASDGDNADEPSLTALSASLDQCESISRHLGLALEVEDAIPEAYVLEVSSPGLTRLFFNLDQMRRYTGDVVEARLLRAVAINEDAPEGPDPSHGGPRRLWRGALLSVEEDAFTLAPATVTPEGEVTPESLPPVRIPWEAVRRASRMYIFRQPQKPGKGRGNAAATKPGGKPGKKKTHKSSGSETHE